MINIDKKELEERIEKVDALVKENEKHFINLLEDCQHESEDSNSNIRRVWDETWDAYQNNQDYSDKEDWQSAIVIPKAFSTVQQAKSIVRKAMTTSDDFYQLIPIGKIPREVQLQLEVARRIMSAFQNERQGNFPTAFVDATEMAFVTGQSMEMIPTWKNNGFRWELVEPWKIYRDPNALPREPFSGNYWIHEEWVDVWLLKEMEKLGRLKHISDICAKAPDSDERNEKKKRAMQLYTGNKHFRSMRVREFWGTIIDDKGEMLLPTGTFMIAGDKVIKAPRANPYSYIRWPGVSFSPIPHLQRYEGRGILEGVVELFETFNNLMNLHMDNLNWSVNPVRELAPGALNDPEDDEIFPGKVLLTTLQGLQGNALRLSDTRSTSPEVLANAQMIEKLWQNSTFVSEFLEGLPGSRTEITKGEVELKTEAGLGVFNSMARDLERGAQEALWAAYDIISYNLDLGHDVVKTVTADLDKSIVQQAFMNRTFLYDNANISVNGISNLIKRADMLKRIEASMMKAESPTFGQYIRPYNLIKAYADILDLNRYDAVITPEEAQAREQQSVQMAQQMAAAEASGVGVSPSQPGGQSGQMRKLPEI